MLINHTAFKCISKLEKLANDKMVKIKFVPKFLCEPNPIKGFGVPLNNVLENIHTKVMKP